MVNSIMTVKFDNVIKGLVVIEPDKFSDNRGWYSETYQQLRYGQFGIDCHFVQDNESMSIKGVFRGLHWQAGKWA